jgi:hypothetical protein
MDNGREPDARDPTTSRGDGGDAGVEQAQTEEPTGRSSEEGGTEPTAAETFDEEGAGLAAKE